jgi:hypothetical protein
VDLAISGWPPDKQPTRRQATTRISDQAIQKPLSRKDKNMYWSIEDTLKVIGLILFIAPFVVAIRQLYKSADKLKAKRERENKSS